jgi:hypothetical protein
MQPAAKAPSHASRIITFLTKRLALSAEDLLELRDAIDAHLQVRVGVKPASGRRTLYLPTDSLDDL